MNERGIVETDDHDDDAWSHAGQQSAEVLAEVETKYETAAAKDTKTAVKEITANMKVLTTTPLMTYMIVSPLFLPPDNIERFLCHSHYCCP